MPKIRLPGGKIVEVSREDIKAIARTKREITRLNKMLDIKLPGCPKLGVTENTSLGDTPDLISKFNAEFREYLIKLGITDAVN